MSIVYQYLQLFVLLLLVDGVVTFAAPPRFFVVRGMFSSLSIRTVRKFHRFFERRTLEELSSYAERWCSFSDDFERVRIQLGVYLKTIVISILFNHNSTISVFCGVL